MSSIMQILRRIGGTKATPTAGSEGQIAVWKAGKTKTDATSLYFHDSVQWVELLDTRGKTMSVPVFTGATAAPASPRFGDFWLNTGTNLLSIWDGASWLSTDPHPVSTGTAAPTAPTSGSLWLDPVKKELQVWDGTRWAHVAFTNVQNTFVQPQLIDVTSPSAALHIKQLGAGDALRIEDEANPDTTPFVVDQNGNVGIGAPTPAEKLHVVGKVQVVATGNTAFTANGTVGTAPVDSDLGQIVVACNASLTGDTRMVCLGSRAGSGDAMIRSPARPLYFNTANADRMMMDMAGNVFVGQFDMNPIAARTYGTVFQKNGFISSRAQNMNMALGLDGSSGSHIAFYTDNGSYVTAGNISSNGANTTYGATSDYRLKENVTPIENASDLVKNMRPVNFDWKPEFAGTNPKFQGFIAHEIQEVAPYAVVGKKDAVDENGQPVYQTVDPAKLVALLTASLQDALKRIDALEART